MRICSWNVNGLRAIHKKGFADWLGRANADIVGLQETRLLPTEVPDDLREPHGYRSHFVGAERRGYSGVGMYARKSWDGLETDLQNPAFDTEGRVQIAHWGKLTVANIYFPNGSGKERDNSRVPYKLDFYRALHGHLAKDIARGQRVLVMGDFNTAHAEIDLARPKENQKTSGFLPDERQELTRWLGTGFVDTFRHFDASPGKYSWWSQRFGVRAKNIGWRIDYVFAHEAAMPFVQGGFIEAGTLGSDHCPVGVDVDPKITQ